MPAKLVGRDIKTDLALLKVTPKKPLPATHFGDSDKARIGDWVIAIGDPFGIGSTVTAGIVSARNRDINAGPYDDFIQTDAPINRGNSGGPLFDMDGNVVGINSQIFSPSGGSVGIGFAIPSNLARDVVAQLRQFGVARRGWIGVRIQQVTRGDRRRPGPSHHPGRAGRRCDAGRAGRQGRAGQRRSGHRLRRQADGDDSRTLPRIVADTPIGKTVNIDVLRKGSKQSFKFTVAKLDEDTSRQAGQAPAAGRPAPSTEVQAVAAGPVAGPLDGAARAKFKIAGSVQGVVVSDVDPDSPAADKNFHPGDVIVEVQSQAVNTPDDVAKQVDADVKAGRKVELMLVNRAAMTMWIA